MINQTPNSIDLIPLPSPNFQNQEKEQFINDSVIHQEGKQSIIQQLTNKQQQYFDYIKPKNKNQLILLNNYQLIVLNDKLELSEDDEEKEDQDQFKINKMILPFQNQFDSKNKIPRQDNFVLKKKKKSCFHFFKSSFSRVQHELNHFINKRKNDKSKSQQSSFIFSPDGYGKLMWDLLCMTLIFYEIVSIPFKISFDIQISQAWDTFVDVIFVTDILISFNTAYYRNGIAVYSRTKIALNYLKFWFWMDVLASFPHEQFIGYIMKQNNNEDSGDSVEKIAQSAQILRMLKFVRFVKIVRLLRLAKLKVIFDKLNEFLQFSTTIAAILSFLQLSFFVLFWSHWLGCIFHFLAMNEDSEDNWLYIYGIYDEPWQVRYVNSIYWAVTTMNTVGYGDISPQTPTERLVGIFFLLVATIVFSFNMNTIGSALQAIEDKKSEQRKRINDINNYMKKVKLDSKLQNRVRKYLTFIWDSNPSYNLRTITNQLSNSLKYEFTLQVNGIILGNCITLVQEFSSLFLKDLTQIFLEKTFLPDEIIFYEQESIYKSKNLYFIQEGKVDIMLTKTSQVLCRMDKSQYFGEVSFFTNIARSATAKSVNFTDSLYIERSDFINLLQYYQNDKVMTQHQLFQQQRFCKIRDGLIYKNDYQILGIVCYACSMDDHIVKDCPSLHFIVNLPMLLEVRKQQLIVTFHIKIDIEKNYTKVLLGKIEYNIILGWISNLSNRVHLSYNFDFNKFMKKFRKKKVKKGQACLQLNQVQPNSNQKKEKTSEKLEK